MGGELLFTGGYSQGQGDQENSGWRYSIAQNRWETAPELPWVAASSAAQLDGYAWFGSVSGDIGGRGGTPFIETGRVAIYDPASETWRDGPAMITPRAGFASAASGSLLIVAGGEVLGTQPARTLRAIEAISAGAASCTPLPDIPTPVHGVPGALHGNAFYLMGGSGVAGAAANTSDVQVLRW